jgi:lysozyme
MNTSDKGIAALIEHEGIVPGPYFDSVGVQTYGVGHTAAAGAPDPALMPAGMPKNLDAELERVFDVFRNDLAKYEADVDRAITVPVSQHEFDAAVCFHYNTGAISTAKWVKTLNAGDRAKAAEQIMNWTKPEEIIPRRQAEQRLFRDGVYPDGQIVVWQVNSARKVIWTPARTLSHDGALQLMGRSSGIGRITPLPPEKQGAVRTKAVQSKTIQASATQVATGAGGAVAAVAALDGTAQLVAIGGCVLIVLLGLWIMRERLKAWSNGWR